MKKEDVAHLASLARIRLTEEELTNFEVDLSSIVQYVSTVNDISAEQLDASPSVGPICNVFRADKVSNEPNQYTEKILKEMPATKGRLMVVKKILKTDS